MSHFSTIDEALECIKSGQFVIVMDDECRENEGDLIMAAELATPERIAFALNHTSGILCAPMPAFRAAELQLHTMVAGGNDPNKTAFTISVDSMDAGTGVSASDRAMTFRRLADAKNYRFQHFRKPGHVFPLIARAGGVLERRGHTEAAVDLCKLAGLNPVGMIGELMNTDGTMKQLDDCVAFAKEHQLKVISVEQLAEYRARKDTVIEKRVVPCLVELVAQCELPIGINGKDLGMWTLKCFLSHLDGRLHVALKLGKLNKNEEPVLIRIHSECFTGEVLGSQRCDCGEQLSSALEMIASIGKGILVYCTGQEGRGIGLANKVLAYQLQQSRNIDTYSANHALGFDEDLRSYGTAKAIVKELGVTKIRLLTGNKRKMEAFQDMLADVVDLSGTPNTHNSSYLQAKRAKYDSSALASIKLKSVPTQSAFPTESSVKLKIGIVKTSWNVQLVDQLAGSIKEHLLKAGILKENLLELCVPGAFEIPWAAKSMVPLCDVVICVGILLKGETFHFEMISQSVALGMMKVQLESGVPVINGVLNCLAIDQAEARCGKDSPLIGSLAMTALRMGALKVENASKSTDKSAEANTEGELLHILNKD